MATHSTAPQDHCPAHRSDHHKNDRLPSANTAHVTPTTRSSQPHASHPSAQPQTPSTQLPAFSPRSTYLHNSPTLSSHTSEQPQPCSPATDCPCPLQLRSHKPQRQIPTPPSRATKSQPCQISSSARLNLRYFSSQTSSNSSSTGHDIENPYQLTPFYTHFFPHVN